MAVVEVSNSSEHQANNQDKGEEAAMWDILRILTECNSKARSLLQV